MHDQMHLATQQLAAQWCWYACARPRCGACSWTGPCRGRGWLMPQAPWLQAWTRSGRWPWRKSAPGRRHLGKHRSVDRPKRGAREQMGSCVGPPASRASASVLGKQLLCKSQNIYDPQSKRGSQTFFTTAQKRLLASSTARVDNCAGREEGRTERAMVERSMFCLDDFVSGMRFRERYLIASSLPFLSANLVLYYTNFRT